MTANTLLSLIILIAVLGFVWDNLLDIINLRYAKNKLPEVLAEVYKEEEYQKSLEYQKVNARFSFFTGSIGFVVMLFLLIYGVFGTIETWIGGYISNPIWRALAFFAFLTLVSDILTLPFQLYAVFVIEEKFGFNKNTLSNFFLDKIKGLFLGALLGGLIGYAFLYLVIYMGESFWIYFWLIFLAFSLLMNLFYTSLILPLFNKLTPLPEGELRTAIEAYCKKVNFPLTNLFIIDGSKRSTKSNAFFSGFGKRKKVVLYDTLIEKHSIDELVAVLAHEVGHYKKKHIPLGIVLSALQTGVILYILSLFIFNPLLSEALGAKTLSIPLNLMAFSFLFSPISMLVGLFFNVLSRKNEFEADRYAKETFSGESLKAALKKLSTHNLSNLNPHPWYVFFNYSHPPLLQRLNALESPAPGI